MTRIVTLVANPANPCLSSVCAETVATAVGATATYWLADNIACYIPLPDANSDDNITDTIRQTLGSAAIDVFVQEADTRRKKALIADMDSTMIGQECIDELADELGLKARVSEITERAMNGEIPFEGALIERVGLLKDLPVSVTESVWRDRITLTPGGGTLIATMKKFGGKALLVSGGFTTFTEKVAKTLGFNAHYANQLLESDGRLTGDVARPILGKLAKVENLHKFAEKHALAAEDFIAVGDGANDLDMLELAGCGVAYHAKPIVAQQAKFRVDHGDLTALLYLQGYRQSDFEHPEIVK